MSWLAKSWRLYWGPWIGALSLLIGGTGHVVISAAALSLEPLQHQSLVLADAQGDWLHVRVAGDAYRLQPQAPVSANTINLLLAYEDRRFRSHFGVDLLALGRAAMNNLLYGQVVSGASTLSMQVSRLLRPHRRNLSGKIGQALGALWLEREYSKSEILQMYLTLAPYGGNVQGIEMASRWWFNKPPQALSLAESALLVALPQRPAKHRPDRFPKLARQARDRVLRKGYESGLLSRAQYLDATHSPLPRQTYGFVQLNHHLADRAEQAGLSGLHVVTLDRHVQRELNALAQQWPLLANQNLAMVALDHEGQLIAHVGSQDYFDSARKGAVDFTQAVRSPGSTLKPLIYAMAETAGVLRYEEAFVDQATHFGGYAPENYDRANQGRHSFGDALTRSHNRAAVEALRRLSPARFAAALTQHSVELHGELGLPMAVGGVGITLEALAASYVPFINQGHSAGQDREAGAGVSVIPMISAAAAERTNYLLRRAALPPGVARQQVLNPFALKTGTGPRGSDTLSVLYTQHYVLAVWVGSPDNEPVAGASGLKTAAPLALAAMDVLPSAKAPQSLATGPTQRAVVAGRAPLELAFPANGAQLAFPPGTRALRPRLNGGEYPITVILNGRHRQQLNSPGDLIRFPSAGFWSMGLQDAQAQRAQAQVRVW